MKPPQLAKVDTESPRAGMFAKTRWSLVLAAARNPTDTFSREALARLCESYWGPLYRFARRVGKTSHEAEDLTQAFFARLLRKNSLSAANPARGTFRSFLVRSLRNFMANEWQKDRAQKRDPGCLKLSSNAAAAETQYLREPVDSASPDKLYEHDCAWALVEKAIASLRARYEASGKIALYEQLKPILMGDEATPYRELAERLHKSENALREETYRMRKELRRLLEGLLAPTTSSPADLAAEIQGLFQALS